MRYLNAVNRVFKYIVDIIKYKLRFYKKKDSIVCLNSIYNNHKSNKNSFINTFYYEIKRYIFEIIKNKKVLLYSLLKLNMSLSSRLLRQ